jgi:hypothetical protein
MQIVSRCWSARRFTAAISASTLPSSTSQAPRIWTASPVSRRSLEVRPKWIQRPAGPIGSATA